MKVIHTNSNSSKFTLSEDFDEPTFVDNRKGAILNGSDDHGFDDYDLNGTDEWVEIASKQVPDSDGFLTDYTWYGKSGDLENEEYQYVFVFGDKDLYRPEDGDFDWAVEPGDGAFEHAQEWFNSYTGFDEGDGEIDIDLNEDDNMHNYHFEFSVDGLKSQQNISAQTMQKAEELIKNQYNGKTVTFSKREETTTQQNEAFEYDDEFVDGVSVEDPMGAVEVAPQSDETPKTFLDNGIASTINSLIKDEWEAIEGYNSAIATLKQSNSHEDMVSVLTDIATEENKHVGQLQKLMELVSPNAGQIKVGEAEAEKQIEGTKSQPENIEQVTAQSVANSTVVANPFDDVNMEVSIADIDDSF